MKAKNKNSEVALLHKTRIRVRFSEVDSMAIVWHGEYVRYFEDGREAFGLEYQGLGYMDIYASGYGAPMVEMNLSYKQPLKCNDVAIVETKYIDSDAAKIIFEYEIRRENDGVVVATGRSMQVFINGSGELQLTMPDFYKKWKERWIKK